MDHSKIAENRHTVPLTDPSQNLVLSSMPDKNEMERRCLLIQALASKILDSIREVNSTRTAELTDQLDQVFLSLLDTRFHEIQSYPPEELRAHLNQYVRDTEGAAPVVFATQTMVTLGLFHAAIRSVLGIGERLNSLSDLGSSARDAEFNNGAKLAFSFSQFLECFALDSERTSRIEIYIQFQINRERRKGKGGYNRKWANIARPIIEKNPDDSRTAIARKIAALHPDADISTIMRAIRPIFDENS